MTRLTLEHGRPSKVNFDLNAELKEVKRSGTKMKLRYNLFLDAFPAVQRAELEGDADVDSPVLSSVDDLNSVEQSLLTELALEVYRQSYEILYLLFDSLELETPSPWMVKDVHLVK